MDSDSDSQLPLTHTFSVVQPHHNNIVRKYTYINFFELKYQHNIRKLNVTSVKC